jgi:PadR family transcriptional regulator AphA
MSNISRDSHSDSHSDSHLDMPTLSPTAKVILGFLRFRPRSGYDIKRSVELSTRFFWGASFGQIYPELNRLERSGLVEVEQSAEAGRRRKVFRLTKEGERALDDWMRSESDLFQYRDEGLLRLFFGDLVDLEAALDNVRRMREWREEVVGFFHSEIEPHAREDAEEGHPFPQLALEYGIAMLESQAAWLAGVERELEGRLTGR